MVRAASEGSDDVGTSTSYTYRDDARETRRLAAGLSRLSLGNANASGGRTFASQPAAMYGDDGVVSAPGGMGADAPRIRGEIKRVTFHSKDNGYTVARMEVDGSCELPPGALATPKRRRKDSKPTPTVTVVGTLPGVSEGQMLELVGQWKENAKYGVEFVITGAPIELKP